MGMTDKTENGMPIKPGWASERKWE